MKTLTLVQGKTILIYSILLNLDGKKLFVKNNE